MTVAADVALSCASECQQLKIELCDIYHIDMHFFHPDGVAGVVDPNAWSQCDSEALAKKINKQEINCLEPFQ